MKKRRIEDFSVSTLALTFFILQSISIGRYKLSSLLDLTEAKTRILLKEITELGFAMTEGKSSGRKGTNLTRKGILLCKRLRDYFYIDIQSKLVLIPTGLLPEYKYVTSIYLRGLANKMTGLVERDLAVRAGATGSIALLKNNNQWQFPDGFVANIKVKDFQHLDKYDHLIIVFSSEIGTTHLGAMKIAEYYFNKEIIEIFESQKLLFH